MKVAVAGLGKIGIPLAVQFASKGANVCGYDSNAARVSDINEGRNPISGEPNIDRAIAARHIKATADPREAAAGADVIVLIVPVDIDSAHQPDFAALDAAVEALGPHLERDALVIVETTVPVGTTRNRVGAAIERLSGLVAGRDFALGFSPERVSSGTVLLDLQRYPKVVGGIDIACGERAATFYRQMLDADVMVLRDAETAEFSKLAETTYRDVNIALANEFARLAGRLGVDVGQAIDAANSQPYSHVHQPGLGVGGHCIPVYPYFLAGEDTPIIANARRTNDAMAAYGAELLAEALGTLKRATVVILGLSYRANVKESRHSSALLLTGALSAAGAQVYVHDPLFSDDEIRAHGLTPPPSFPLACDAIAVQAWHAAYDTIDFAHFDGLRAVLDGRGALSSARLAGTKATLIGIGKAAQTRPDH